MSFAVLDRDQTGLSRDYALNMSGSRYFIERAPIADYADLDRRMRSGELTLAVEIPPGFARDVQRGKAAQIGAWVDGAMPQRASDSVGVLSSAATAGQNLSIHGRRSSSCVQAVRCCRCKAR